MRGLAAIIIAGPQHGQLIYNADGSFNYVSDLNYNGTDNFTYKANDGVLDSNIVSFSIAAVNDAPVAVSATVTGSEDTPYLFTWSDFRVSDADSDNLLIIINNLQNNGLLQYYDGLNWSAVLAGQRISKTDIVNAALRFIPDANESGVAGQSPQSSVLSPSYADFTYQADDGFLSSAVAGMSINIIQVADTPSLELTTPADGYGVTTTRFSTSCWSADVWSACGRGRPRSRFLLWCS